MVHGKLFGLFQRAAPELMNRCVVACAHGREQQKYFILLDQCARLLNHLCRVIAIIERDKLILRPLMPPSAFILSK